MRKCLILFLVLTSVLAAPNLIISSSQVDPSPARAGSELFLNVLLQNYVTDTSSVSSAKNLRVELVADSPFDLKVERERVTSFPLLCENCNLDIDYHLYVKSSAQSGTYPLKFVISYETMGGADKKFTQELDVEVRNYEHTVGVSNVELSKDPLSPGDKATLSLDVKNYGVESVDKIELTLSSPESISILGSTKRFFLEDLHSDDTVSASYELMVDSDAEMGAYSFPLSINVTDRFGNEKSFTDDIGLQVNSQPEIEFSVRSYDPKTGEISTLVANRGQATAKYVMIKLEGLESSPSEVYVGNLDSDDYSTADFTVTPQDASVDLTAHYVDSNNVERTISRDFEVSAPAAQDGSFYWMVGGVVLLIVVVYWFFFRKRKKKSE